MSNDEKEVLAVFHNFDYSKYSQLPKWDAYAEYLITLLSTGYIPVNTRFPSVSYLHEHNDLSYRDIQKAFRIMAELTFLIIKTGQNAIGILPEHGSGNPIVTSNMIMANYHIKQPRMVTLQLQNIFKKVLSHKSVSILPVLENSVSFSLIGYLVRKYNELYSTKYIPDNFYYALGLPLMLQAVLLSVYEPGSKIVIPVNTYIGLPQILKLLRIDFVEVDMDGEGLNMTSLKELCKLYRISAVFMMSKASFPKILYTSEERIKKLFDLQEVYLFKIVEIDFYLPWLEIKANPVIMHAGKAIEDVIYIYPLTFLLKDLSEMMVVTAQAEILKKIKVGIRTLGDQPSKSMGDAAYEILSDKKFTSTEKDIAKVVKVEKKMIVEIFAERSFWQMRGIIQDSGLALFLIPKQKRFPKEAFRLLRDNDLLVFNPKLHGGKAEEGLRLDLSNYAGHHNFESNLKDIERKCREICI